MVVYDKFSDGVKLQPKYGHLDVMANKYLYQCWREPTTGRRQIHLLSYFILLYSGLWPLSTPGANNFTRPPVLPALDYIKAVDE